MTTKKKKSTKKTVKKQSTLVRLKKLMLKHKILSVVALVIVSTILAANFYNVITDFQDERTAQQYKKQLDQVDKEMGVEFEKITSSLGQPSEKSNEKVCEYVSADLSPGLPACGPVYSATYYSMTRNDNNLFIDHLAASIKDTSGRPVKEVGTNPPVSEADFSRYLYRTYDKKYEIQCTLEVYGDKSSIRSESFYAKIVSRCDKTSPKPIYREVNK